MEFDREEIVGERERALHEDPESTLDASEGEKPTTQRQRAADASPRVQELTQLQARLDGAASPSRPTVQAKGRGRGLPDDLKSGVEATSSLAMDDVRVHYDSPEPAQLRAAAFARGSEIHLGPGQEQHLPHEAWHVVQQKQGRVSPTTRVGGVGINDDAGLEREADHMGARALQRRSVGAARTGPIVQRSQTTVQKADPNQEMNLGDDDDGWKPVLSRAALRRQAQQGRRAQAQQDLEAEPALVAERRLAIVGALGGAGFQENANTFTQRLDGGVRIGNLQTRAHLTINRATVEQLANGPTDLEEGVLALLAYHITVERSDNLSDPTNPRWYSTGGGWKNLVGEPLEGGGALIEEAQEVMEH